MESFTRPKLNGQNYTERPWDKMYCCSLFRATRRTTYGCVGDTTVCLFYFTFSPPFLFNLFANSFYFVSFIFLFLRSYFLFLFLLFRKKHTLAVGCYCCNGISNPRPECPPEKRMKTAEAKQIFGWHVQMNSLTCPI